MWILIGVIAVLAIILIITYNSLISARNNVTEAFAAIDVYLEQRFDALSKIAEAVVAYARHESDTLTKVTELRSRINSLSGSDKIGAYQQMDGIVKGLTLQAEAYPELQAKQQLHAFAKNNQRLGREALREPQNV